MTEYFFQIILLLVGLFFEILALLLQEKGKRILLGILGLIIFVIVVIWFIHEPNGASTSSATSVLRAVPPASFVDIPVNSESGATWAVPATGMFSLSIESGAYNGWPTDSECTNMVPDRPGCWRTRLHAYIGCEIIWQRPSHSPEMSEPMSPSFALGDVTFMGSLEAAQSFAVSLPPQTVRLNAGDCIRFVVIDGYNPETGFSAYLDNRGDPSRNNAMRIRIIGPQ